MTGNLLKDSLNTKIAVNVLLKSKLLCGIFGFIFVVQVVALCVLRTKPAFQQVLGNPLVFVGPVMIALMCIAQGYFIRLSNDWLRTGVVTKQKKLYTLVAIEVSFPCMVLWFTCWLFKGSDIIHPVDMMNSPVLIFIFIFIILSSLYLDFKVALISAVIPAIQYILITVIYLPPNTPVFFSGVGKGVLMVLCGLISGIISKKIQEGIHESVESKNLLINELDRLVHEKTIELHDQNAKIRHQKKELEVKQKEILDSIHYASRIQKALMIPESHFEKNLNDLQGNKSKKD